MLPPLEVGALLSRAGYADHVVAAGILHDVLENTDTDAVELKRRFGPSVSALVRAVSEDRSIEDEQAGKSALRSQVAGGSVEAAAIFPADKVTKARELRLKLSCGLSDDEADQQLGHYWASLSMLEGVLGPGYSLLEQLRFELETLDALPSA